MIVVPCRDRPACFNPPPAVRPGESYGGGYAVDAFRVFQSAPGGEAGGKLAPKPGCDRLALFQSAPGGEAGGKTRCVALIVSHLRVSIRPRR